jgi:hypothetical protein
MRSQNNRTQRAQATKKEDLNNIYGKDKALGRLPGRWAGAQVMNTYKKNSDKPRAEK